MKKTLIISLVALLSIALSCGFAYAVVQGQCANCHTMHNSQNGVDVAAGGPYETLLIYDCMGCHGQNTALNIEFAGTTPQVLHQNATDLAGGNFAYITGDKAIIVGDTSSVGHNVIETGVAEATIPNAAASFPPGDEHGNFAAGLTNATFTCGGVYGCHGDRTVVGSMAAISGSHHANDDVCKLGDPLLDEASQGGSVALSYRFLLGVLGGEDPDWQATTAANEHNEYKGATNGIEGGSASDPGGGTISGFCAECHGNFHGPRAAGSDITDNAAGSPWLRHPTDIVLDADAAKEYQYYNGTVPPGPGPYSLDAPVGRAGGIITAANYPANSGDVTVGSNDSIVICLSCHKVHGSEYEDILRWNYSTIDAGTGVDENTRCFICHTTKDTGS